MSTQISQHKVPLFLVAVLTAVLYVFFLRTGTAKTLVQQSTVLKQEIAALPEVTSVRRLGMGTTFSWIRSIPNFLSDLTQWAKNHAIVIVSIEPGLQKEQVGYTEQPVKLEIQGRFRKIGDYLTFLEDLPRPLLVTDIRFTSPTAISPDLLANLELLIYIKDAP